LNLAGDLAEEDPGAAGAGRSGADRHFRRRLLELRTSPAASVRGSAGRPRISSSRQHPMVQLREGRDRDETNRSPADEARSRSGGQQSCAAGTVGGAYGAQRHQLPVSRTSGARSGPRAASSASRASPAPDPEVGAGLTLAARASTAPPGRGDEVGERLARDGPSGETPRHAGRGRTQSWSRKHAEHVIGEVGQRHRPG